MVVPSAASILIGWMKDRTPPRVETEEWWRERARKIPSTRRTDERPAR
jgi:hypothetical protein